MADSLASSRGEGVTRNVFHTCLMSMLIKLEMQLGQDQFWRLLEIKNGKSRSFGYFAETVQVRMDKVLYWMDYRWTKENLRG